VETAKTITRLTLSRNTSSPRKWRPCNVYWHVTAPYKLSFIIIIIKWCIQSCTLRASVSNTDQLDVCQTQCPTVGDQSFAMAGARLWNSLPDIVACDTQSRLRREPKTFLFRQSYPFYFVI